MARTVVVQSDELWSGAVTEKIALSVPIEIDLSAEQAKWFASGGGDANSFANFLIAQGCTRVEVEFFTIEYLS